MISIRVPLNLIVRLVLLCATSLESWVACVLDLELLISICLGGRDTVYVEIQREDVSALLIPRLSSPQAYGHRNTYAYLRLPPSFLKNSYSSSFDLEATISAFSIIFCSRSSQSATQYQYCQAFKNSRNFTESRWMDRWAQDVTDTSTESIRKR